MESHRMSLTSRAAARASFLYAFVCVIGLAMSCGCSTTTMRTPRAMQQLRNQLSETPLSVQQLDFVSRVIDEVRGDALLSIYWTEGEADVSIRVRYFHGDTAHAIDVNPASNGEIHRVEAYSLSNRDAAIVLSNLYEQAGCGFRHRVPGWPAMLDHPYAVYTVTLGRTNSVSWNEGGMNGPMTWDALRRRRIYLDDSTAHAEPTAASFDRTGFTSIAAAVDFQIECFDMLAEPLPQPRE